MMLILADRTNVYVGSTLYYILFLITVGNSYLPGEIIWLQVLFHHFLLQKPRRNEPPITLYNS